MSFLWESLMKLLVVKDSKQQRREVHQILNSLSVVHMHTRRVRNDGRRLARWRDCGGASLSRPVAAAPDQDLRASGVVRT